MCFSLNRVVERRVWYLTQILVSYEKWFSLVVLSMLSPPRRDISSDIWKLFLVLISQIPCHTKFYYESNDVVQYSLLRSLILSHPLAIIRVFHHCTVHTLHLIFIHYLAPYFNTILVLFVLLWLYLQLFSSHYLFCVYCLISTVCKHNHPNKVL